MNSKKAVNKTHKNMKKRDKLNRCEGYYILWSEIYYGIEIRAKTGKFNFEYWFAKPGISENTKEWIIQKLLKKGYVVDSYRLDTIKYIKIQWRE